MTRKTARDRALADDTERVTAENWEARKRERRAALARYMAQARIDSMYLDAALGRPV